ncbi:hypothetical protein [Aurantimonas sp. Leaf443]|uniref:hypothetical protein n=1 Tax=Aurantimonas sp. Leaf443 TaxID=1736378 RepID=UPI00070093C5|nr:hypothetical protein [Aurantimonas sp. Leaf443]KQT88368.1 hypothetical protein ASG48_02800 [Aurantimonas sp. Leaf443]
MSGAFETARRRIEAAGARLPSASWPLVDQGVLSLGTFVFNIVLARHIALEAYGLFAMALGILLLMQAVSSSMVFYPLSIVAAAVEAPERRRLILTSLLLTLVLCLPLALVLSVLVWALISPDLLLPALFVLVAGQIQDALRRALIADFRHFAPIAGDVLRYGGQVAALMAAATLGTLSIEQAFWVMGSCALAGALVQWGQLSPLGAKLMPLRPLCAEYLHLGKWSLLSNVMGLGRVQTLPWLLALLCGTAAAGAFQIAMNIVNLSTPIVTGICNVVPQVAARALARGHHAAWRAVWPLAATGLPLIGGLSILMLAAPAALVRLFYGPLDAEPVIVEAIRIFACGSLLGYAANVACAYLHGVRGGRDGLVADVVTTAAMILLAPSLTLAAGLPGAAIALTIVLGLRGILMSAAVLSRLEIRLIAPRGSKAAGARPARPRLPRPIEEGDRP